MDGRGTIERTGETSPTRMNSSTRAHKVLVHMKFSPSLSRLMPVVLAIEVS